MKSTVLSPEAFSLLLLEQQAQIRWPAGVALRHFKGHEYLAYAVVESSETGEAMVLYQNPETGALYVRSMSSLVDEVMDLGGVTVPRFKLLELTSEDGD